MIDLTMSPETREEKPTVSQPTNGFIPQTPHVALRTKSRNTGEGPIESLPLSVIEKTSDDSIMPPEEILKGTIVTGTRYYWPL